MTVLIVENAAEATRGQICRWMLEVKPGVFIAKVSAIVREAIWKLVKEDQRTLGAILAYSAPTEIGFMLEMYGEPRRSIIDMDGLQLIKRA